LKGLIQKLFTKKSTKHQKERDQNLQGKNHTTIPTHHTRAVYYSIELRKEMGEMDGLGEK